MKDLLRSVLFALVLLAFVACSGPDISQVQSRKDITDFKFEKLVDLSSATTEIEPLRSCAKEIKYLAGEKSGLTVIRYNFSEPCGPELPSIPSVTSAGWALGGAGELSLKNTNSDVTPVLLTVNYSAVLGGPMRTAQIPVADYIKSSGKLTNLCAGPYEEACEVKVFNGRLHSIDPLQSLPVGRANVSVR